MVESPLKPENHLKSGKLFGAQLCDVANRTVKSEGAIVNPQNEVMSNILS